jgi:hypothetical protein
MSARSFRIVLALSLALMGLVVPRAAAQNETYRSMPDPPRTRCGTSFGRSPFG